MIVPTPHFDNLNSQGIFRITGPDSGGLDSERVIEDRVLDR